MRFCFWPFNRKKVAKTLPPRRKESYSTYNPVAGLAGTAMFGPMGGVATGIVAAQVTDKSKEE